jgi:hypothetical protein
MEIQSRSGFDIYGIDNRSENFTKQSKSPKTVSENSGGGNYRGLIIPAQKLQSQMVVMRDQPIQADEEKVKFLQGVKSIIA